LFRHQCSRECAGPAHSPVRRNRVATVCALAFLLGINSGCYVYPAVVSTPAPGTELRLDLNDQGRVALGGLIGASAQNVEGVLRSPPDTAYLLSVTSVSYLRGQTSRWSGEPLTIAKQYVANTTERTLSKSRTWLTTAIIGGGLVALIITHGLSGGGFPGSDPGGGGGGASFR
jgi:hypothetical protein